MLLATTLGASPDFSRASQEKPSQSSNIEEVKQNFDLLEHAPSELKEILEQTTPEKLQNENIYGAVGTQFLDSGSYYSEIPNMENKGQDIELNINTKIHEAKENESVESALATWTEMDSTKEKDLEKGKSFEKTGVGDTKDEAIFNALKEAVFSSGTDVESHTELYQDSTGYNYYGKNISLEAEGNIYNYEVLEVNEEDDFYRVDVKGNLGERSS